MWRPSITTIRKEQKKAKIELLCSFFKKSKQAYYKQLKLVEINDLKNNVMLGLVKQKRDVWKRGSGRNLHKSLATEFAQHDLKIGRDKFFTFLREHKLLIRSKRFRAKTTCSFHHFNKFNYLIKDKIPTRKNEIWVSDITYIWLRQKGKFCYLSLITDLYSRKIVGYCLHKDLSTEGCLEALKMALSQRQKIDEILTHHSDRGVQYCSHNYVELLKKYNIEISMTQSGDPLENAVAERINKTIKEEFTTERQMSFRSLKNAKESMGKNNRFLQHKKTS